MRRKEVEEAIKSCNLLLMGDITLHIINDDGGTGYAGAVNKQYNDDIKILLNYTSELENARSPYFIPKAIIKIKIEEYNRKILELYKKDLWKEPEYTILKLKYENYIQVLKELLGE